MRRALPGRALLRRTVLLFAMAACWFSVPLAAQTTGQIRGHIVDAEKQPLSATVSAARADGSFSRRTTSGADGTFSIAVLPPGVYQLTVQRLGYQPAVVRAVTVAADHTSELTVTLTRAAATLSAVVVEAPRVTIKRGDTQFETSVSADAIAALPIGLDIDKAVALTPGARPAQMWGGATAQANNYQLDGVSINHPGVGGRAFEPNVSWIEQLDVRGLGAGAEYGDFQGGLVNMITKSGSNTKQGFVRAHIESSSFNPSGLTSTVIVPEVEDRREAEAEYRGPIVRDRLFYYVSGEFLNTDSRAVNHLGIRGQTNPFFSPVQEGSNAHKVLGKLTFAPTSTDLINFSLGHLGVSTNHYALSGRETADATSLYSSPTFIYDGSWEHQFEHAGSLQLSIAGSHGHENVDPYAADSIPGISTYQLATSRDYQNAPFTERRVPGTDAGTLVWRAPFSTASVRHRFALGADLSVGTWNDDRRRNGGMTWRPWYYAPLDLSFDPAKPQTWDPQIPLDVGGDVNLHTRSTNSAVFVEDELTAGRLTLTPGIRAGGWSGRIQDPTPNVFTEVHATGLDPRMGAVLDLSRTRGAAPTFVLKAHWGRYHQNMFSEMFDRAAGSAAYTDQDLWQYEGPAFTNPATTFTAAQRDSLQRAGQLKLLEHADLSETGAVSNYRQPYVDQFVGGVEKTIHSRVKIEALYIRRDNRDQVGLVDRNLSSDWYAFDYVSLVTTSVGGKITTPGSHLKDQNGAPLLIQQLWVPKWAIIQDLRDEAAAAKIDPARATPYMIPGFTPADTATLLWNPNYQLTTIPAAQRHFQQVQLNTTITGETWDATLSVAWTDLRGNFASVTGYDDYTVYGRDGVVGRGPGPYVRPNEAVNDYGRLENFSPLEVKVRASAALPWRLRGGIFVSGTTGDPVTPSVSITPYGLDYEPQNASEPPLPLGLISAIAGERIYTAPRGAYGYRPRASVDLHLERDVGSATRPWTLAVDAFNVFNDRSVVSENTALEAQEVRDYAVPYLSPLQLVDPRRIRLGAEYHF